MKFTAKQMIFAAGLPVLLQVSAHAESVSMHLKNDPYFQIAEVNARIIPSTEADNLPDVLLPSNLGLTALNESTNPLSIVDAFLKVWEIIEKNKAVANVESKSTSALPKIAKDNWIALTGWQPERGLEFALEVKNLYGMKVVELKYQVKLLAGGSYRGIGKYIASARVVPTEVSVLWGYQLNVGVNVASVVNEGTENDPLASVTLEVRHTYGSSFRKTSGSNSFVLRGDGVIKNKKTGEVYF